MGSDLVRQTAGAAEMADVAAVVEAARSVMIIHTPDAEGRCTDCALGGEPVDAPCPLVLRASRVLAAYARATAVSATSGTRGLSPHPHRGVVSVPAALGRLSLQEIPEGPVVVGAVKVTAADGTSYLAAAGADELEQLLARMLTGEWAQPRLSVEGR